jgi:FSR family fosmidomycin resistance protein-like MFS transporter
MTLMLGHFTVDMYAGFLPVLYPVLIGRFTLDLATVGLLSLAYSGASSLVQPFFGWLADRSGTRFIGIALLWTGAMFALLGFASSFPLLLVAAALAGVGSGMYHPFGALNAAMAIGEQRQRNTAMSIYVTGGTFGVALGPLIGVVLIRMFGMTGTALMFLPGALIAAWLLVELRGRSKAMSRAAGHAQPRPGRVPILPMLAVIGVMMSRQWTTSSLQAYIPSWYAKLGYGPEFYGPLATALVLASAFGAVGAGSLADKFGRRQVIVATLLVTAPALWLFSTFHGPVAFPIVILVGLSAASTGPLMIVMAQQLMVGRAGVASGLILGLGFITGAIGIPITGALADSYGMETAIRLQVILVIATIGLAMFLPTEKAFRSANAPTDREA